MYAVYLCGPTDCFLHNIYGQYGEAEEYAIAFQGPEGFVIKEWKTVADIDVSDTGWFHQGQKDGD